MPEENAWAAYMRNTRLTEEMQSDIVRRSKEGEDPALLLIDCAKALSLLTNNPMFAEEIGRNMRAVRGHAFEEPALLNRELEETEARLARIEKAMETEEDLDLKEEMDQAIRAHRARIERLGAEIRDRESAHI